MEKAALQRTLEEAANNLFEHQPNIFDFTPETGQTEWNLAHHLAIEIHKLLQNFDCDLDVMKVNLGDRRPDIIFHTRGMHEHNFLVVETKRDAGRNDTASDLTKIREYWFSDRLHYEFGAAINLKSDKTFEIVLLSR